jgi:hypothetical protein
MECGGAVLRFGGISVFQWFSASVGLLGAGASLPPSGPLLFLRAIKLPSIHGSQPGSGVDDTPKTLGFNAKGDKRKRVFARSD